MRTLDVNELEAVAGGRSLRREDSLSDWLDALIGSLTVSVHGSLDRTSGGGGSDVDWNADPSSWFGGGGGGGGDSSDEGLQAEEWVQLWSEKFKTWSESDRKAIGNSMVATGALYMKNPFAMSAGQFLTLLGAAIAEGDVNSAAFYCDQLERTTLNQTSKDVVLGGLEAVLDVAKIFKDRFGK